MTSLRTGRLVLRPFVERDVPAAATLLADPRVSRYLLRVPPSTGAPGDLAIRRGRALIGAIGLRVSPRHDHAELGYWLGAAHWGQGYAREAAAAVVAWGFGVLGLRRIWAQHLAGNHASARVLEAIGMLREGVRRQHVKRRGRWYDLHLYGILREET